MWRSALFGLGVLLLLALAPPALAEPSRNFYMRDGEVYDDWGLSRTRAWGADGFFRITEAGFRPAIAFESLGELADVAWRLGERFADRYADPNERAERIFRYVRDRVSYATDEDQFGFKEYAQNADELAITIEERGWARGDCEDYALLLAVMFRAAGLRSAIVLAPGHAAALVLLPDYAKANAHWRFKGVEGWVWAEATGRSNQLGWTPTEYLGSTDLAAYELPAEGGPIFAPAEAKKPAPEKRIPLLGYSPFFLTLLLLRLMWLLPALRRR